MNPLTLVLHPLHAPGLDEAIGDPPDVRVVRPDDDDGVVEALDAAPSALVTFRWDDRFLVPGLRWLQATSAGIDHLPVDRLAAAGVTVTSARGAHSPAVAEHAVALLGALVRGIGPAVRRSTEHRWAPEAAFELAGRTAGIIGLGSIGEAVAERLRALGMSVIACTRTPAHHEDGVVADVRGPDRLRSVFEDSDVVVLCLPADPTTERLVGARELEALGSGWIVNVGRGSVLDEAALVEALDRGALRGAGLDVTTVEPLPEDSPLWDRPDVVVTPHMAWSSDRLAERLARIVDANLAAWNGTGPWVNRIG